MAALLWRCLVAFALLVRLAVACPSLANRHYAILGPFPSAGNHFGGGDPLEAYGGILNVSTDSDASFTSELVTGGKVQWAHAFSGTSPNSLLPPTVASTDAAGIVQHSYETLDYGSMMPALGMSSVQNFFSWAVTSFQVDQTGHYRISCGNVGSYFVDDDLFVGDAYAISSWWGPNGWFWLPVHLTQGEHTLRLKFRWEFQCRIECVEPLQPMSVLTPDAPSVYNPGLVNILPSIVEGHLASRYLSVPVVNGYTHSTHSITAELTSLSKDTVPMAVAEEDMLVMLTEGHVHPGQVYPLPLSLRLPEMESCLTVELGITLRATFTDGLSYAFTHHVLLQCRRFDSEVPYSITFLDVDGSVQSGSARPPPEPCDDGCALILALHGSDVDSGSPSWTHVVPSQHNAWILMPSNRDKYGYDWQGIGEWSALEYLDAFMTALPGVPAGVRSGYTCHPHRMVFVGHSMGGHGCLAFSVQFPEWALGSLCAAAWIRFDHYVQEYTGTQSSHTESALRAVLSSAVADYHTDLLAVNMKGIPFMAKMGSNDRSVCPWNLRRFVRLLDEVNGQPGFVQLVEVPGEPHWFDGVLSDDTVQQFLQTVLHTPQPVLPSQFEIRMPRPWESGRGGIRILQFHTPSLLASVKVETQNSGKTWEMQPHNVRRFAIQTLPDVSFPVECVVDRQPMRCVLAHQGHYCQLESHQRWQICEGESWKETERHSSTAGPMRQIFKGRVAIVYGTQITDDTPQLAKLAVHVANLLMWRGHSLIHIYTDTDDIPDRDSANLILLGGPVWNAVTSDLWTATTLTRSSRLGDDRFEICRDVYDAPGVGAALLAAYPATGLTQTLVVIVTGTDLSGLKNAVQLIPTYPNAEIPDYVIIGSDYPLKGSGSVLAAGYWGYSWECRPDVSYPRYTCPLASSQIF